MCVCVCVCVCASIKRKHVYYPNVTDCWYFLGKNYLLCGFFYIELFTRNI